jgi:PTH1 family peptidyl-tRNA hydrolase
VTELLAQKFDAPWNKTRCKAYVAEADYGEWRITFAKPITYVNLSGESVRCFLYSEGFELEDLLVVCDDVNLPVGQIRIRKQGGAGGHNGLKSIIQHTETDDFARIRLGVKPMDLELPPELADFVLGRFHKGEEAVVAESARNAATAILGCLDEGIEKAMNLFNRKPENKDAEK